jgi:hypothetical protein
MVTPLFVIPGGPTVTEIIAELTSRTLGAFTIQIADWPGIFSNGQVIADATAPGGSAVSFASTLSACCLVVAVHDLTLLPGDYTMTLDARVPDRSSTSEVAALYVGEQPTDWQELARLPIRPVDFAAAGAWQTFTISFSLDRSRGTSSCGWTSCRA